MTGAVTLAGALLAPLWFAVRYSGPGVLCAAGVAGPRRLLGWVGSWVAAALGLLARPLVAVTAPVGARLGSSRLAVALAGPEAGAPTGGAGGAAAFLGALAVVVLASGLLL